MLVSRSGRPKRGEASVLVRDVSFNGLLMELPEEAKVGEEVTVEVCFRGEGGETTATLAGTVVRCAKAAHGTSFSAGIRLKEAPVALKDGLLRVLPRRAENLMYLERAPSLRG